MYLIFLVIVGVNEPGWKSHVPHQLELLLQIYIGMEWGQN